MKTTAVKWIKEHIKTLAAWVGGVIVTMVMNLINGVSPWPQTSAQWIQYALTSFGAALAVWIAPTNKITQKQLDKDPNVVGGVVVPDRPAGIPGPTGTVLDGVINVTRPAPGTYPSSWQ